MVVVIPRSPHVLVPRDVIHGVGTPVNLGRALGIVEVQGHLPVAQRVITLREAAPPSRSGRGLHPRPGRPRGRALALAQSRCAAATLPVLEKAAHDDERVAAK